MNMNDRHAPAGPNRSDDMLARFKRTKINHPTLKNAHEKIIDLIDEPGGSAIFLVFGPTGVGKSTLVEGVARSFVEAHRVELERDPQLSPPIVIRAPAPTGTTFSWRDFLFRGVEALGEPLPERKLDIAPPPARLPAHGQFSSVDGARRMFETAVRARRPAAIFIDESQHLTNVDRSSHLKHLDFIKSLSDATESVFFLVGTYDLTRFRNLNGQLGRRTWDVHLPRYGPDDPAFGSVATTFAAHVSLATGIVAEELPYLYERCCGCVGVLKQWFVRALARSVRADRPMSMDDLRENALPAQALLQISAEIVNGERALEETGEMMADLRANLGIAGPVSAPARVRPISHMRVGKRSPTRDPIGAR